VEKVRNKIIAIIKGMGDLTPAETTMMQLMAEGNTPAEAAEIVNRSIGTINTHLKNIRIKFGATNTLHAVTICIAQGIIEVKELPAKVKAFPTAMLLLSLLCSIEMLSAVGKCESPDRNRNTQFARAIKTTKSGKKEFA